MFSKEARTYIEKLISIQRKIKDGGYTRSDQATVNRCRINLEILLKAWNYSTNELMANFWINHRHEIRYLLPTDSYKGFKALLIHFELLDKDSLNYAKDKIATLI